MHQTTRPDREAPLVMRGVRPANCSMEVNEIARRPFYTEYASAFDGLRAVRSAVQGRITVRPVPRERRAHAGDPIANLP